MTDTGKPDEPQEPVDRVVEIERLANLSFEDYQFAHTAVAKKLKIAAGALDKIVAKKRRELGLDVNEQAQSNGQGRKVKIADPLPWPDPVDGDQLATSLTCAIRTYIALPDVAAADAIALWAIYTWSASAF